jgi:hypothetical protein
VLAERDTDSVVADTAALAGLAATLADVVAALADVAANMPAATRVVLIPARSDITRNFFLMIRKPFRSGLGVPGITDTMSGQVRGPDASVAFLPLPRLLSDRAAAVSGSNEGFGGLPVKFNFRCASPLRIIYEL